MSASYYSSSDTELRREGALQIDHQMLHRGIHFRVLQSPLSILHNYAERNTFLPVIDAFSGPDVEQMHRLNERRTVFRNAVEKRLKATV